MYSTPLPSRVVIARYTIDYGIVFPCLDFLGSGRISLKDLLGVKDSPWEKTVLLEGVASGEVTLKIALTLNESDLLL